MPTLLSLRDTDSSPNEFIARATSSAENCPCYPVPPPLVAALHVYPTDTAARWDTGAGGTDTLPENALRLDGTCSAKVSVWRSHERTLAPVPTLLSLRDTDSSPNEFIARAMSSAENCPCYPVPPPLVAALHVYPTDTAARWDTGAAVGWDLAVVLT